MFTYLEVPGIPRQIDLGTFGPWFFPSDPIRVSGNVIEVDVEQNGVTLTFRITVASSTAP